VEVWLKLHCCERSTVCVMLLAHHVVSVERRFLKPIEPPSILGQYDCRATPGARNQARGTIQNMRVVTCVTA
jgi:hypothetical protein